MNIREITLKQWDSEYTFTPVLLSKVFGDGGKIAIFETMNDRPLFWIVKIDSKTDFDNDENEDLLQEVWGAVESEFGERFENYDDHGYELKETIENDYPAVSSDTGACISEATDAYLRELTESETT